MDIDTIEQTSSLLTEWVSIMIGREKEQKQLRDLFDSPESEFVAVFGRRRVGKTFLIRETFNEEISFQHTGLANGKLSAQLSEFQRNLHSLGLNTSQDIHNWYDAFATLAQVIQQMPTGKKVIFLDELPWMDTVRSNFISALEHFWNGWASARKDILLIVCGSATSWMINKVIKDKGGLHNRITSSIYLEPFTLHECEQYAASRGLSLSRRDVVDTYMILGGIPYYWRQLDKALSIPQNIDQLFFSRNAKLKYEYKQLYESLFRLAGTHTKIIATLNGRKGGMTRKEIAIATKLPENGNLTRTLEELEQCGFIRSLKSFQARNKNTIYQLIDHFTMFYLKFIHGNDALNEHYWSSNTNSPALAAWRGLAFERVCLWHIRQIKESLGIAGVSADVYAWKHDSDGPSLPGTQIDLLIDRADHIVNICEIKYTHTPFEITNAEMANLYNKIETFLRVTKTSQTPHLTFVTANGLAHNANWHNVQSEVLLNDLFRD